MRSSNLSHAALLLALSHSMMPRNVILAPSEKRASDFAESFDAEREAREREARRVAEAERLAAAEAKRARKNARRAAQMHKEPQA